MPLFVPQEVLDQADTLRDQNERMAAELAGYEEMRPLLQLAEEVRGEITAYFDTRPDLNAPEIAERAYQNVLARHMDKARGEVTARYEQEHRRGLYEKLLGEVATNEGPVISEQVRVRVETDPDLAQELRVSARKELMARATDVVRSEITAEQEVIINQEAERQLALDRLDVRLALDRELDLTTPEVTGLLKPGDKVELFFSTEARKRERLVLTWMKDAKGKEGWVYTSSSKILLNDGGYEAKIADNRFVDVGIIHKDLENGKPVPQIDKLVIGMPLMLVQKTDNGRPKTTELSYRKNSSNYPYSSSIEPVVLAGTDFQTKDIVFTNASGAARG